MGCSEHAISNCSRFSGRRKRSDFHAKLLLFGEKARMKKKSSKKKREIKRKRDKGWKEGRKEDRKGKEKKRKEKKEEASRKQKQNKTKKKDKNGSNRQIREPGLESEVGRVISRAFMGQNEGQRKRKGKRVTRREGRKTE